MPQAKVLNKKEFDRVMAVIAAGRNKTRNRIMFLMSFWAGMRVGEIAAVKISDIFDDEGKVKNEIRLKPEQTKGKNYRTVMLCEKLQRELAQHYSTLRFSNPERPLIFSQRNRLGFSSNSLSQEFKTIYDKASVAGASSHSGRRTFITTLANKGIGVRVLQEIAGHRSIATTQLYIDVNDEMMRMAIELV